MLIHVLKKQLMGNLFTCYGHFNNSLKYVGERFTRGEGKQEQEERRQRRRKKRRRRKTEEEDKLTLKWNKLNVMSVTVSSCYTNSHYMPKYSSMTGYNSFRCPLY